MIADIVDIFTNIEGVELVRLSGMTRRANSINKNSNLPSDAIDRIIKKLKYAGVINYKYVTKCPHCGEQSYIILCEHDFKTKPKMCDTCNTFYSLIDGHTIEDAKSGE
jgi:hypothetical protein